MCSSHAWTGNGASGSESRVPRCPTGVRSDVSDCQRENRLLSPQGTRTRMQLKPPDSPELIHLVADWLSRKENYQWLDFGDGRQQVSAEWLKIAMQRGTYLLRVFTSDVDDRPIGLVGLSNINERF